MDIETRLEPGTVALLAESCLSASMEPHLPPLQSQSRRETVVAVESAACGSNRNVVNFNSISPASTPQRVSSRNPPTLVPPEVEEGFSPKPRSHEFVIANDGSIVTLTPAPPPDERAIEAAGDMNEIESLVRSTKQSSGADHFPHIASHEKSAVKYEKPEPSETPWYCTRRFMLILALLVIIGIVVGITVPLASKDDAKTKMDYVLDVISEVSDEAALNDLSKPQYAAMNWILNEDSVSSLSDPPTEAEKKALLQRYILAVFYFSTDGDNWSSRDGWLEEEWHECDEPAWKYLTCENREVVSIEADDNSLAGPRLLTRLRRNSTFWLSAGCTNHLMERSKRKLE